MADRGATPQPLTFGRKFSPSLAGPPQAASAVENELAAVLSRRNQSVGGPPQPATAVENELAAALSKRNRTKLVDGVAEGMAKGTFLGERRNSMSGRRNSLSERRQSISSRKASDLASDLASDMSIPEHEELPDEPPQPPVSRVSSNGIKTALTRPSAVSASL
eukprot:54215-Prymnesium_polylepis.2